MNKTWRRLLLAMASVLLLLGGFTNQALAAPPGGGWKPTCYWPFEPNDYCGEAPACPGEGVCCIREDWFYGYCAGGDARCTYSHICGPGCDDVYVPCPFSEE